MAPTPNMPNIGLHRGQRILPTEPHYVWRCVQNGLSLALNNYPLSLLRSESLFKFLRTIIISLVNHFIMVWLHQTNELDGLC